MILPGATLGVLGGGQLGRMFLYEAKRMGYKVRVLDPDPHGPSAPLADGYVQGAFDDAAAAVRLAEGCDVVTLETEHIPADVLDQVAEVAPLLPGPEVLRNIQDRLAQRRFLEAHDLPQPHFAAVDTREDLARSLQAMGTPAVLKTRRGGYDGKGQFRLDSADDVDAAWAALGGAGAGLVLEAFVPFTKEVSVVLARGVDGEVAAWPLAENVHRAGILHTTMAPADVPLDVAEAALDIATRTVEALGHVGTAAVEMFLVDGRLLINEVAPRTHNSGHYTLNACVTSQFEQHVRAVCGLPLGNTAMHRPAAMVNLLGDLWPQAGAEHPPDARPGAKSGDGSRAAPDWSAVLTDPHASLHLYGKRDARPGRKMGHVVVLDDDAPAARRRVEYLHKGLALATAGSRGP